jgi:hypothetical protein
VGETSLISCDLPSGGSLRARSRLKVAWNWPTSRAWRREHWPSPFEAGQQVAAVEEERPKRLEQNPSFWLIAGRCEEIGALFGRELRQGVADRVPEARDSAGGGLAQMAFSFANAFSIGLK